MMSVCKQHAACAHEETKTMPKKSFVWLTMMLCMLLPLVAACGSSLSTNTSPVASATLPAGENIYVLDGYTSQGVANVDQSIVAFHPGSTSATYRLPAGLTSMDHHLLVAAKGQANLTTISVIDTQSGATVRTLTLAGNYSTAGQDFNNAVLSMDGRWLALRQLDQSTSRTTIALVDTQAGKLSKIIHLNGDFDLDTISLDGNALYLLQRLNDGTGHYYVQLYSVSENKLYQSPIVDKSELNDPNMTGTAVARQFAPDASATYTLYIDAYHNIAFVHILPLDPGFPFARCINLPVGKSSDLLHYYTLALSSDGTTLYAANGALGVVSEIHLNTLGTSNIYSDQVVATGHFNPGVTSVTSTDKSRMLRNGAVLSSDQSTLYFAGLNGIWSVKTADLGAGRVAFKHLLGQQSFTGLALSANSKTLYAVDPASGIMMFDTTSGQVQQTLQAPARAPWDIEWIVN
jgi:DNA-binding beta-propeller fold protein YncE